MLNFALKNKLKELENKNEYKYRLTPDFDDFSSHDTILEDDQSSSLRYL